MSTVFRIAKTKDYTVMSNHHLKDPNLSLKTKGLMSVMLSLPDEWDYSIAGLKKITGEGRDSLYKCLKELETNGYLVITQKRDDNGRLTKNEYLIYECPDCSKPFTENPYTAKPSAEKQYTENPVTGKPFTENQLQLNNIKSNTDKSNTKTNQSINQSENEKPIEDGLMDGEKAVKNAKKYEDYEEIIKENISYELFELKEKRAEKALDDDRITLDEYEKEMAANNTKTLNSVIGYMLDVICGQSEEPVIVNGNAVPRAVVRSKLLKIDYGQMSAVIYELNTNRNIHNRKNYSISMLYNS